MKNKNQEKNKRNIYEEITNNILKIIEETGELPWQCGWLRKHFNGFSKKEYIGFNQLWLSYYSFNKGYEYPVWFTFKQISELGGKIKKGAKSTKVYFSTVWAPQLLNAQCKRCVYFIDKGECAEGNDLFMSENWDKKVKCDDYEGQNIFYVLKHYNVFNIAETDLKIEDFLSLLEKKEKIEAEEIIQKIQKDGVKINFGGQRACYIPPTDSITMPIKQIFKSIEEYYVTFFHEIAHATGHQKRLNRKSLVENAQFGSEKYSYEELVAELGSAFLCIETSVQHNQVNSAAYIKNWASYLKEHKKAIVTAACDAQKAVEYIKNLK